MLRAHIDHLVVTAPDLDTGAAWVRQALGVEPGPGGAHVRMGTHNRLLRLGASTYLEVIAIDPAAPAPTRARWFGLDELEADASPRLATWVVRTSDIEAALAASPVVSGYVTPMSRGDLSWRITVPRNGGLPLQGVAPTLIQWQDKHPAATMQESGCSLVKLEGFHPRAQKVNAMLDAIGFQGEFSVSLPPEGASPRLVAHIRTPAGIATLPGNLA
jgi:hypothetical protein